MSLNTLVDPSSGLNPLPTKPKSKSDQMRIALGIIGLFAAIFGVWHLLSRRFSLPCPVWLRWMVELDNPFTRTNRAAVIIAHLQLEPSMAVLDAGCGPGRLTIPLAKCVGESGAVTAMDVQPGMLRRVQVKAGTAGLQNIQFIEAGLGEGRLAAEAFDRVVLVTGLGEIPERAAAWKGLVAARKPGGILSVTEVVFDPHFQRRGKVASLATEAGFRLKAFFGNSLAYTLHLEKPSAC